MVEIVLRMTRYLLSRKLKQNNVYCVASLTLRITGYIPVPISASPIYEMTS